MAVDLDGVLRDAQSFEPLEGAQEWLHSLTGRFRVVVFTTRGRTAAGRAEVRNWLGANGFPFCQVTALKLPEATLFIDDKGWRFEGVFPTVDEVALLVGGGVPVPHA